MPWVAVALVAILSAGVPRAGAATTLRAFVTVDVSTADPGDLITYTIALDNLGPATADRVWANLTVPTNTMHMWDIFLQAPTCGLGWVAGNRRGYNCTDLPTANNTIDVTMRLLVGPPDGTGMTTTLAVNYTDDTGAQQSPLVAVATVTMSIPELEVTKTPATNPVDPGDPLAFTISVRNTGSMTAGDVWLNDTLPSEVTFERVRNIPPSRCTNEDCHLANLGVGVSETYNIDVTVSPSTARGTSFLNVMFVNFTDADGTLLTQTSASASVDVRVIQDLTLDKAVDQGIAFPGARVTFAIWYNNTATSPLGTTWINDTLPSGMTHDGSTPPGTVNGNVVRWQFASIPVGANSIQLAVAISSSVANATVLTNDVTGDYLDGAGNPGQRVVSSASVAVSDAIPSFDGFWKVAARPIAAPGETVRFTIYYNNTGFDRAASVVIEDTVPPGTTLTNPSALPTSNGRWHQWRFTEVPVGDHSLSYDLVLENVNVDTTLVNFAFLNFTDASGRPLLPAPPRSAVVRVVAVAGGTDSTVPLLAALVFVLAFGAFVAYRTFAKPSTVIDEVFLLHKDGLLIKHYTRRVRPDVDSDILSGMLIAVQNFVNESFIGSEGLQKEGQLDELRFGEFKLVIERGRWIVVAAVLSGDPTNRVKEEVNAAIRDMESALPDLEAWTGEMKLVEGADRFMQDLITGKYRKAWGKG